LSCFSPFRIMYSIFLKSDLRTADACFRNSLEAYDVVVDWSDSSSGNDTEPLFGFADTEASVLEADAVALLPVGKSFLRASRNTDRKSASTCFCKPEWARGEGGMLGTHDDVQ
jgi:hypothetical protein